MKIHTNVLLVWLVSFAMAAAFILLPAAQQYSVLNTQISDIDAKLADAHAKVDGVEQVKQQIVAYRSEFQTKLGSGATAHVGDAFAAATRGLASRYHVSFTGTKIEGPVNRPALTNMDLGISVPTPPPSGPSTENASPPPGFIVRATPNPMLQHVQQTDDATQDDLVQGFDIYQGTVEIDGSYRNVIAALEDLSRQGMMLRVLRGGVCRPVSGDENTRSLTLSFRLYVMRTDQSV